MVLLYDARRHVYTRGADGRMVPSVTTILKWKGLVPESARTSFSGKYLARGRRIHRATAHDDAHAGDGLTMVMHGEEGWVSAWRDFVRTTRADFDAIETRGHWHGLLAGTVDRIAYLGTRRTVIDIKTGPKRPWHRLQTAGYLLTHDMPADAPRLTVHVCQDGTFTIEPYDHPHDRYLMMQYTTEWWNTHGNPEDVDLDEDEAADLVDE